MTYPIIWIKPLRALCPICLQVFPCEVCEESGG